MARPDRYKFSPPRGSLEIPPVENKDNKSKLIIAVGLAAVVIILIALGGYSYLTSKESEEIELPNVSINVTPPAPRCIDDECFLKKAIDNTEPVYCGEIIDENKRQTCYAELSLQRLDACMKVSNYSIKSECINYHALETVSTELCKELQGEEEVEKCTEAIDPCYYKPAGTERQLCLAFSKNDYKQCNKDENCIIAFVQSKPDMAACNELDISSRKNLCVSLVLKKDVCGDLATPPERDYCRAKYAKVANQSAICADITRGTPYAEECYVYMATLERNRNYCNNLELENRWSCFINYTTNTGDLGGCEAIPTYVTKSRSNCGFFYATKYYDPQGCLYISDSSYRKSCYANIVYAGLSSLTVDKCSIIDLDEWKNRCFTNIGKRDKNTAVCDYIDKTSERNLCIGIVQTSISNSSG